MVVSCIVTSVPSTSLSSSSSLNHKNNINSKHNIIFIIIIIISLVASDMVMVAMSHRITSHILSPVTNNNNILSSIMVNAWSTTTA